MSNGYYYTYDYHDQNQQEQLQEFAGYYPQATTNFLVGATLKF